MIITEKSLINLLKDKETDKVSTLYMQRNNINSIFLKNCFFKVEFLSLQNNNIKVINFLKNLPNIWYLDIRNNPIESYDVINSINCFGFLGLSVEKYSEKKILSIKKINVGIITLIIDDYYKKGFIINNPNIIKFNDEIMYYYEKANSPVLQLSPGVGNKNNYDSKPSLSRGSVDVNSFKALTLLSGKPKFKILTTTNTNAKGGFSFLNQMPNSNDMIHSNLEAQKLALFFNIFSSEINMIITNPLNIVNNTNSVLFQENLNYLNEERKKLKILAHIYEKFLLLNNNENFVFHLTRRQMNSVNNIKENIIASEEKNENGNTEINPFLIKTINFSNLKIKDTSMQIIILIIIILHILQITAKEFSIVLIKYVFKTFLNLNLKRFEINSFLELEVEYLLGVYYDTYDSFKAQFNQSLKTNTGSINNTKKDLNVDKIKYEEILKCLEMNNLILKCNILNKTRPDAIKIYSTKNDLEIRKILINSIIIKLVDEKLKIFDETLNLIQYLNDFIVYHKIDNILLQDLTLQYRVFIEIKGLMFIHLNKKTKDNLIYNTLTDRKYTEHRYKRLGNKLFFTKNPVECQKNETEGVNNVVFGFFSLPGLKSKIDFIICNKY